MRTVNKHKNERTNIYNLQHFSQYHVDEDLNRWERECEAEQRMWELTNHCVFSRIKNKIKNITNNKIKTGSNQRTEEKKRKEKNTTHNLKKKKKTANNNKHETNKQTKTLKKQN
jgi:ABC-type anion transport system duplicated permease subunit